MKTFMVLNLFVLCLIFSNPGHALVLSENVEGVTISSIVVKDVKDAKSDHYICLGSGWNKADPILNSQIRDLKVVFPDLFQDIGENEKNCFAPNNVPVPARKKIDEILSRIDTNAGEQFNLAIGMDGQAALTELKSPSSKALSPLRNQDKTIGRKLLRAELLVGGAEAFGMGLLINLPHSITKWTDNWQDDAKKSLKRAWTQAPVMDHDELWINYIGHPLAGAVYYNALRSQGATRLQSLLFSTVQSSIWEYGIEAIAERPSIQDLIVTPLVGSFVGELAHMGTMRMKRNGFSFGEKVLITVINPSYVLNNGFK